MARESLENALRTVHEALQESDDVDPGDIELLRTLDDDIHRLLSEEDWDHTEPHGLIERAEALAARFRASHPQLETVFREIVNTLARIGV